MLPALLVDLIISYARKAAFLIAIRCNLFCINIILTINQRLIKVDTSR